MTEDEWLACADPLVILERLRVASQEDYLLLTQRKGRLFAIACCRRAAGSLKIGRIDPLDVAERHAEGIGNEDELQLLRSRLKQLIRPYRISLLRLIDMLISETFSALRLIDESFRFIPNCTATTPQMLTPIAREIFGNPFRPVTANPSWLTSTVLALAQGIYQGRAFDRMPILADAIQDAGCDNEDILNHCREPGEHFRGCWVVDVLTGRK